MRAFPTVRYSECSDGSEEDGLEKIVLYAAGEEQITHAARQLPTGTWAGKLSRVQNIEYSRPDDIDGGRYGEVVAFLKRAIPLG